MIRAAADLKATPKALLAGKVELLADVQHYYRELVHKICQTSLD